VNHGNNCNYVHDQNGNKEEDYESNLIITKEVKQTPSVEIIVTIPKEKGLKVTRLTWD
jgi:hypothetical protein